MIKTGDDHSYYLLKLTKDPYETDEEVIDDYNHTFPPNHKVVEGNYFEVHKEIKDGELQYIDFKSKAIISAFCVVGNCPPLPTEMGKRRGKTQEMYLINNDLHQALCEVVDQSDI